MKKLLALLLDFARKPIAHSRDTFHDDTLRANQGQDPGPAFSFWRSLVS